MKDNQILSYTWDPNFFFPFVTSQVGPPEKDIHI